VRDTGFEPATCRRGDASPPLKILEKQGREPNWFTQGDRPRLPMGRRDSDWPVLAPHRFTDAGRTGASAAHGRRPTGLSQRRHPCGTGESVG